MQLTAKIKLVATNSQKKLLQSTLRTYIDTVNNTADRMIASKETLRLSSKDIFATLPSAVKNQAIRDSKTVVSKYRKTKRRSILRNPMCTWNNQNYKIVDDTISFPIMIKGKSKRIRIKLLLSDYHKNLLENKHGTLRITKKSKKWFAQIAVDVKEKKAKKSNKIMGVDLGIKVPAVAHISNHKTKFFGNGRENKYVRRR